MPSMALSAEKRDGAYYCTPKFSGGLIYNPAQKQWEGSSFENVSYHGNFVMKLAFRETTKYSSPSTLFEYRDEYDVTITNEGSPVAASCLELDGKPPFINGFGVLRCNVADGLFEYKFNFANYRFIRIYTSGYVNGADNNDNTPAISGGLCTKIQ
jgi:hypothetical protein